MKRGNRGFAEELLFMKDQRGIHSVEITKGGIAVKDQRGIHSVEMIKGGIAPRRSPLYILPWARGCPPQDPRNDIYPNGKASIDAIIF